MPHPHHLGPLFITLLIKLLNLSVARAKNHAIWTYAVVVTILEAWRSKNDSITAPISLLCRALKILQQLIIPTIMEVVNFHISQHGFKPKQSTTSALLSITDRIRYLRFPSMQVSKQTNHNISGLVKNLKTWSPRTISSR